MLLVGFQAEGTRGRRLLDGEKTSRIHGIDVPVNASVTVIDSMSAHADSQEILRWLRGFEAAPTKTFLVHGEPAGMQALQQRLRPSSGGTCTRRPGRRRRSSVRPPR